MLEFAAGQTADSEFQTNEDVLIQQMMDQIRQDERNFEFQIDSKMIAQMPPDPSERFFNPQLPENYLNLQKIIRIDYLY